MQGNPQCTQRRPVINNREAEPHEEVCPVLDHREQIDPPILKVRGQHDS